MSLSSPAAMIASSDSVQRRAHLRRLPEMQDEAVRLVLEQNPVAPGEQTLGLREPRGRDAGQFGPDDRGIRRVPDRGAVLARDRVRHAGKQGVDLRDRSAGDDRHCIVEPRAQGVQDVREGRRNDDAVRCRRDVEQRAVQVEQQRRVIGQLGGRSVHAGGTLDGGFWCTPLAASWPPNSTAPRCGRNRTLDGCLTRPECSTVRVKATAKARIIEERT